MAYLKMPETLKKDKPAQAGQGLTQSATGGKVASVAPETAFMRPTGTTSGQPSSQSSGASRFVNFDKILAANIPGATGMAQDVLTKAAQQGQQAEQLTKEASKTFKTDVEKGTQKFKPTYIYENMQSPDRYGATSTGQQYASRQGEGLVGDIQVQQPGETSLPGESVSLAETQRRAATEYAGPKGSEFTGREDYRKAQQATTAAQQTRNALATDTGLEALLNQMYGTAGGTGGSRLDAALARVAGGPSYEASRKRFANLDNILLNATAQAQQQAQEGEGTSLMTQQQYMDLLDKYGAQRAEEERLAQERSVSAEAARARAKDAAAKAERETKWARDRVASEDRVATIDEETQAAMMGMTLEEWIAAGRPWGRS